MAEVTLGGERLGSGKKNKVYLREYERSTHDLSYVWRSTMASGTLVPFMAELALPGDTFDIDLNVDVMTHPTIGPLFGSYKVQLDLFSVPIRLYNPKLHMNMLGIGLNMKEIYLPQVRIVGKNLNLNYDVDGQQVNPSSIYSYLGIRGLGYGETETIVSRAFNGVPYLAYWDIYKNYYANKQEEIGYVIHNDMQPVGAVVNRANMWGNASASVRLDEVEEAPDGSAQLFFGSNAPGTNQIILDFTIYEEFDLDRLWIYSNGFKRAREIFANWAWNAQEETLTGSEWILNTPYAQTIGTFYIDRTIERVNEVEPKLREFRLSNIDEMRLRILQSSGSSPYEITHESIEPYNLSLQWYDSEDDRFYSVLSNQEGLGIKTYQSDLFNNWMSTEWIDGDNGINEITRISTTEGYITIDEINLSRKIYDMLNRIAISGGTYDDWLDATYTHDRVRSVENPVYVGGLSRELVFQEVVSTAAAGENTQPLGTLAGKGILSQKKKGGSARVKIDEPSFIMGIVSLTPRIDYSQGNKWSTNLQNMDDFHKPALDEIGFQDLITDQMAYWETDISLGERTFKSAGKQPAWINYMTNVNQVKGNFALQNEQMYMTLNRRYEAKYDNDGKPIIKDLTTYIDPSKFNHIFADTRRDAQNFWTQIGVDITARRKMSAKIMPNL